VAPTSSDFRVARCRFCGQVFRTAATESRNGATGRAAHWVQPLIEGPWLRC